MRLRVVLLMLACAAHGDEKDKGQKPTPAPRRYTVEILYTVHKKVDKEAYQRIERLFAKSWPAYKLKDLEPSLRDMRTHYNLWTDRLLAGVGRTFPPSNLPAQVRMRQVEEGFRLTRDQIVRELKVRRIF